MLKILIRSVLLVVIVCTVLGGVIYLGRAALDRLRGQKQDTIRLADIACEPPPVMSRVDFLDEVQYLTGLPAELHLLDDGLPRRLAEAFAQHPWVEKVERVQILAGNNLRIQLKYRAPVLAVPWGGQLRAVDAAGVLLPGNAPTDGLPVYRGTPQPPHGPAGAAWGDANVTAAAKKAAGGDSGSQ